MDHLTFTNDCRGVPTGYIAALEQRLLTTEIALYEALSFLHETQPPTLEPIQHEFDRFGAEQHVQDAFSACSTTQTKAAKVLEWQKLPLLSAGQLDKWREQKYALVNEYIQSSSLVEPIHDISQDLGLVQDTLGEDMWNGNEMIPAPAVNCSSNTHMLASDLTPGRGLHSTVMDNLIVDSEEGENSSGDHNVLDSANSWPEVLRDKRATSRVEWRNYF